MRVRLTTAVVGAFATACVSGKPTPREPSPIHVAQAAPSDAPIAAVTDTAFARMMTLLEPCRRKAAATWPDARRRFRAGLGDRQSLFVTTRLRDSAGHVEQVFVSVDRIEDSQLVGRLWSDIGIVTGYRRGQALTLSEVDMVDWMISHPDGTEEGNWMGRFMDAYQASGQPPAAICAP